MCGIAGILAGPDSKLASDRICCAFERLRHRGPDDSGVLIYSRGQVHRTRDWDGFLADAEVVFLHRRLSILDLTEGGWQPSRSADSRYYLVFNGEIYNYLELREELASLGHRFQSNSDTEVLLQAFSQWGVQALRKFVGMFAFAVLDIQTRTVTLARDCFGIKPLYYIADVGFAFASEIKALLELVPFARRANADKLYLYLRYGIGDCGPETLLSEIRQVPPGHYVVVSLDKPLQALPVCYWQPQAEEVRDVTWPEAVLTVRDLFIENVALHLRSDVPVGAALSGGIDSSSIVMTMRHLQPRLELHTFSFISDDEVVSEERWVDLVGRASGACVHKVHAGPEELLSDLDCLMAAQDEPFGGTSLYAQFRVFRAAREAGIKVMLDGQGADEMLAGYTYYRASRLASLVRQQKWGEAVRFLQKCSQWPGASHWRMLLQAANYLLPEKLRLSARYLVGGEVMPEWLHASWFRARGVTPRAVTRSCGPDVLRQTLLQELTYTSLPQLLRYEDRNSMAFSIESRVPFLTPALVQFLLSLPEEYIIDAHGTSKAVFRSAMRGIVPDAILDRRDKIGFATPQAAWLGCHTVRDWISRLFEAASESEFPFLNIEEVRRDWRFQAQDRKPIDDRVWRWVNVVKWARRWNVRFV